MTGSTTLNVLSASDLSGGSMSGGLKTYGRNVRIAANGYWGKEAVAARMLATSGLTETEDLFDQLMNGEAELAYGGTDGRAETRVANGAKTIHLGDGASAGSRYQLGLTLSHEAFRNGLDDGNAGQQLETVNAVIGHSRVAQLVAGAYGEDNLSEVQRGEVALLEYAQHTGDISALAGHAIGSYDSGADYWLLKRNGQLVDDNSKDFSVEYLDENGDVRVAEEVIRDGTGSWSRSLLNALGGEQAAHILSDRGIQTEGMSDQEIGEALMASSGYTWDQEANQWLPESGDARLAFETSAAMQNRYLQDPRESWSELNAGLQAQFGNGLGTYAGLLPYYMAVPEIAAAGTPAAWMNDNISVTEAFGREFYAHDSLAAALDVAESQYVGADPVQTFDGAFVPRLIGGRNDLSMHALGLAVDFNAATNGMIRESDTLVMEAIRLMNGGVVDANTPQEWNAVSDNFERLGDAEWRDGFLNGYETAVRAMDQFGESMPTSFQDEMNGIVADATPLFDYLSAPEVDHSLASPVPGNLGWFAQQGFSNHPPGFVEALVGSGLDWLMRDPSVYDSMHFELPGVVTYGY